MSVNVFLPHSHCFSYAQFIQEVLVKRLLLMILHWMKSTFNGCDTKTPRTLNKHSKFTIFDICDIELSHKFLNADGIFHI